MESKCCTVTTPFSRAADRRPGRWMVTLQYTVSVVMRLSLNIILIHGQIHSISGRDAFAARRVESRHLVGARHRVALRRDDAVGRGVAAHQGRGDRCRWCGKRVRE